MSEAPRIDWYPSDWISGTRHLSLEERAVYHDLLMMIYEEHGALREDYRRLARRIAIAPKRLERIVSTLVEEGKLYLVDGFITNERAENELKKRENLSEKARASAKARWAKERRKGKQNQQTPDASALRSQCPADANHLPTANSQKKTPLKPPKGGESSEAFEEWWSHYPRKVAKGAARRAFVKALKKTDIETLTTTVQRFAAKIAGRDPELIPHASTWLNAERWGDEDLAPPDSGATLAKRAEAKLAVARDWLKRHDSIPTWMDDAETAKRLLEEGYDYDALRAAGFRLPPRGKVVDIGDEIQKLARSKAVGQH